MRELLYTYSNALGLLKILLYKIIFGRDLRFVGIPRLDVRASLRLRKGAQLLLGKGAIVGRNSIISVTSGAIMQIGSNSVLGFNNVITCRDTISIGNNVSFGPGVTIFDHDHDFHSGLDYDKGGYSTGSIIIEDNVWLGSNVIVLKGVTIGKGSVVAAGSIVTKDVPPNTLYRGLITPVLKRIDR